jgi:pimeloyl-ACP methyl ester carboxylesterase
VLDERGLVHREIEVTDGVRLHCVERGEGPLVLLLHGFPDFWFGWRHQIDALAAAGFRVVVPDLRGSNRSDKPRGARAYGVKTIVADVALLVEQLGERSARLVGHDWGAGVAWATAMVHSEKVERLAVLNGPHPERLLQSLREPAQLAKLWYMFFFQIPWLPEEVLAMDDYGILARSIRDEPTRPNAVLPAELARYREAWSQPGALTATVNWYRGMFRPGTNVEMKPVDAPTLVLWGTADPHLPATLATPTPRWVPNARVTWIEGASHWVQVDAPDKVNAELLAFLR